MSASPWREPDLRVEGVEHRGRITGHVALGGLLLSSLPERVGLTHQLAPLGREGELALATVLRGGDPKEASAPQHGDVAGEGGLLEAEEVGQLGHA